MLPLPNPALVLRLRRNGIANPIYTIREAKRAGLPLDIACAMLGQESAGGHNVWGHDPVPPGFPVGGTVTKRGYLDYKQRRVQGGNRHMQGCGPTQLTYFSYQDRADSYGGCWHPRYNLRVGFSLLRDLIHRYGLHAGIADYNGSGSRAQAYADSVLASARRWAPIVKVATARTIEQVPHPEGKGTLALLPRSYCFNGKQIMVAVEMHDRMEAFMARHPYLRAYSGYRNTDAAAESDHRCAYALDLVPLTTDMAGKAELTAGLKDASESGYYADSMVWTATQKHGHVSFGRCG